MKRWKSFFINIVARVCLAFEELKLCGLCFSVGSRVKAEVVWFMF